MQDVYKESFIIIKLQKIKDIGKKSIKSREAASKSSYSQSNTAPTLLNPIPSNPWEQLSTLHTDPGLFCTCCKRNLLSSIALLQEIIKSLSSKTLSFSTGHSSPSLDSILQTVSHFPYCLKSRVQSAFRYLTLNSLSSTQIFKRLITVLNQQYSCGPAIHRMKSNDPLECKIMIHQSIEQKHQNFYFYLSLISPLNFVFYAYFIIHVIQYIHTINTLFVNNFLL